MIYLIKVLGKIYHNSNINIVSNAWINTIMIQKNKHVKNAHLVMILLKKIMVVKNVTNSKMGMGRLSALSAWIGSLMTIHLIHVRVVLKLRIALDAT